MKGKEVKKTRSWIKEHIRGLHLSDTCVCDLFGPASTKEANNKPAENIEIIDRGDKPAWNLSAQAREWIVG